LPGFIELIPLWEIDQDLESGKIKADILVKFLLVRVKRVGSNG
jgi:hypothetical protein